MAKVYHNGTWEDCVPRVLKDGAGTFTTLPITISTDRNALVDYQIYGNTGGVGDRTANLFNAEIEQGGFVYATGAEAGANNRIRSTLMSSKLPAGTYTVSSTGMTYVGVYSYDDNGFVSAQSFRDFATIPFTFTITESVYVRFVWRNASNTIIVPDDILNVMLTEGSTPPASFVPFGYEVDMSISDGTTSTTTPIYIGDEPLDKVNKYSDFVDYAPQKIIRAIKKYVLTGDENWEEVSGSAASSTYFRWVFAPMYYCVRRTCTCTHFTQTIITTSTTDVGVDVFESSRANGEVLAIRPTNVQSTTLADFQAWLVAQYAAGTPVTVWCVLTTTEETDPPVPLPEIPTAGGTTIINYNGTPKPSSITVTYHGWHEQQESIRQNDEWTTPNVQINTLLSFTPIDESKDTEEGGEEI